MHETFEKPFKKHAQKQKGRPGLPRHRREKPTPFKRAFPFFRGLKIPLKKGNVFDNDRKEGQAFRKSHFPPALHRFGQRNFIGVFKIPADRQAVRDARDQNTHGL